MDEVMGSYRSRFWLPTMLLCYNLVTMNDTKKAPFLSAKQLENLDYFWQNLPQWLDDPVYQYKYLVLHDGKVKGAYDQAGEAFRYAVARFPQNEFIIQQVIYESKIVNSLASV